MAERLLREPRILFRVDGSRVRGMGHVYRSLAVAEALREGSRAEIAFLMSADHAEGIATVSKSGYPVRVFKSGGLEALDRLDPGLRALGGDQRPAARRRDLPAVARAPRHRHHQPGRHPRRSRAGLARRAVRDLGDERRPRDPGRLLRRSGLRHPAAALPGPRTRVPREAREGAAHLRRRRSSGPDSQGREGARASRPGTSRFSRSRDPRFPTPTCSRRCSEPSARTSRW